MEKNLPNNSSRVSAKQAAGLFLLCMPLAVHVAQFYHSAKKRGPVLRYSFLPRVIHPDHTFLPSFACYFIK